MPAVACIPVFTVAKMFALGVSLVIQDFAAVCGGFGVHPCRPISDGAAHTVMPTSVYTSPMCKDQGNGE